MIQRLTILSTLFILFTLSARAQVQQSELAAAQFKTFAIQTTRAQVPAEILKYEEGTGANPILPETKYLVMLSIVDDSGILHGDDLGYTYGFNIVGRETLDNGIHLYMVYKGDLYAQDEGRLSTSPDGSFTALQKFMNENTLKFMFDNSAQNRLLYYSGELCWQHLDSNSAGGFYKPSTQQLWFHKLINNVRQPIDETDGEPARDGACMGGTAGVQMHRKVGANTYLEGHASSGAVLSTINHASYLLEQGDVSLKYKPGYLGGEVGVHMDIKGHDQGVEYDPSVRAALLLGVSSELGVEYTQPDGNLMNYMKYNGPSIWTGKTDPYMTIYFKYGFGKSN